MPCKPLPLAPTASLHPPGCHCLPDPPLPGLGLQVCQGLDQVKQACAKTSGCAGFTWNGKCGFLKAAVGETSNRSGWTVFSIKK